MLFVRNVRQKSLADLKVIDIIYLLGYSAAYIEMILLSMF